MQELSENTFSSILWLHCCSGWTDDFLSQYPISSLPVFVRTLQEFAQSSAPPGVQCDLLLCFKFSRGVQCCPSVLRFAVWGKIKCSEWWSCASCSTAAALLFEMLQADSLPWAVWVWFLRRQPGKVWCFYFLTLFLSSHKEGMLMGAGFYSFASLNK